MGYEPSIKLVTNLGISNKHRKSEDHIGKEHANHVQVIYSFGKIPEITFLSDSAYL